MTNLELNRLAEAGRDTDGPTTVMCISGSGRSGTTILSVLLSQHPESFNLGQLRDFWKAYAANAPCTCGQKLHDCAFWGELARRLFPDSPEQGMAQIIQNMRLFNRAAHAEKNWTDRAFLHKLRTEHAAYVHNLGEIMRYAREITGKRLFIDTSKSPEVALAFSLVDDLNVRVVNLVRDPRAVAVSWEKKKPGKTKVIEQHILAWKTRFERLERWSKQRPDMFLTVRYEAFTRTPQVVLRQMFELAGVSSQLSFFTGEHTAKVSWADQHLFPPANERVIAEMREDVTIAAPKEWKSLSHYKLHATALIKTYPQGLRHILHLS